MNKRMTNVEFVTELMEFSRYGAMAQLFVMEALRRYSNTIANASPEQFEQWNGLISAEAWQAIAEEIAQKIDQRNGK